MNYKEAIAFIEKTENQKRQTDNKRMEKLMSFLGNPQDALRFIHVAGTNGKGSAVASLSKILMLSGYKTGMYTSPHLVKYEERMSVNDSCISRKDFCELADEVKAACLKMKEKPTVFEKLTAIGFLYFKKKKCDIVVLEVGLGGRLDATNIIKKPELCVIMNIGLEHTEVLGDTLEKIAYEKAGIIKENSDVVVYNNSKKVIETIKSVAKDKSANVKVTNFKLINIKKEGLKGQVFDYGEIKNIKLSLLGRHQFNNAAVVIEACIKLKEKGYKILVKNIKDGFQTVKWDARLSILNNKPLFILDGAHNPQCAKALTDSLPNLLKNKKAIIVCGVLKDKDYKSILKNIMPFSKEFVCLTPDSSRALNAKDLADYLISQKQKATCTCSIQEAIELSLSKAKKNDIILAFGSLYLAGSVKEYFEKRKS